MQMYWLTLLGVSVYNPHLAPVTKQDPGQDRSFGCQKGKSSQNRRWLSCRSLSGWTASLEILIVGERWIIFRGAVVPLTVPYRWAQACRALRRSGTAVRTLSLAKLTCHTGWCSLSTRTWAMRITPAMRSPDASAINPILEMPEFRPFFAISFFFSKGTTTHKKWSHSFCSSVFRTITANFITLSKLGVQSYIIFLWLIFAPPVASNLYKTGARLDLKIS